MPSSLHSPAYQVFRQLVVNARHQAHLRQVDLAERLGKPQSYVSKYERGERRLDFTEFMAVAAALNLDVHEFVALYNQRVAAFLHISDPCSPMPEIPH